MGIARPGTMIHGDAAARPSTVTLVEVGPRDGFQPIGPPIPTERKIDFIRRLHAAGVRRLEATAFVSETAVPQLADATEVLAAANAIAGLDAQVLVPNARHAERALAAGARHLAFVLSVSEKHNRANVRRTPIESACEYARIMDALPDGIEMRLNLATAFDCPFEGPLDPEIPLGLLEHLVRVNSEVEICLCDTTGRATPDRVASLISRVKAQHPDVRRWAFHGHDTYGLGIANVLAAIQASVDVIDAAFAGLGGCPFAPGASGNVATEDVVWTLERMGILTGVNLDALIEVAADAAALPGALLGGRVRDARRAALSRTLPPISADPRP